MARALASAFAALALALPGAQAQLLDWIVAVVNEDVISATELESEIDRVERSILESGATAVPAREVLRARVLDLLIDQRLQVQRAEILGIEVTEGELDRVVASHRERNGLEDDAEFADALAALGFSEETFRDAVRHDILIGEAVRRDVLPYLSISDDEIDQQLRKELDGRFISEYRLRHIYVGIGAAAAQEEDGREAYAESLRARILGGEEFAAVAAAHSESESSLEGGNLGWRDSSLLPDAFLDTLEVLEIGDVSPVIRTANGFHLLKLEDKREIPQAVEEVRVRLSIITLDSEEEGAAELAEDLHRQLAEGADFAELAERESIDPASAAKGGDIGWVNLSELLPQIGEAVLDLEPGEISPPVRSDLGLHIIRFDERTMEKASEERIRQQAVETIRNRRAFEAQRNWVNFLRSNAHIEIKEAG